MTARRQSSTTRKPVGKTAGKRAPPVVPSHERIDALNTYIQKAASPPDGPRHIEIKPAQREELAAVLGCGVQSKTFEEIEAMIYAAHVANFEHKLRSVGEWRKEAADLLDMWRDVCQNLNRLSAKLHAAATIDDFLILQTLYDGPDEQAQIWDRVDQARDLLGPMQGFLERLHAKTESLSPERKSAVRDEALRQLEFLCARFDLKRPSGKALLAFCRAIGHPIAQEQVPNIKRQLNRHKERSDGAAQKARKPK